jgi:murein DD-endopeptidase MepM/ murein hydrolase activator NlpD
MKKWFKQIKLRFRKGFTVMVVPNSRGSIKSCTVPFAVIIFIALIIICNIYILVGFAMQTWKIDQFKRALNDKNHKILRLIKDQKQIKPTLQKSYQINAELNRLKQERARLMEQWRIIQKKAGRSVYSVSRGVNIKLPAYLLSSSPMITEQNNLAELDQNLEQIQNFIKIESKEQEKLLKDLTEYENRLDHIPSINPVSSNRITSLFGRRVHPKYGYSRLHTGIDLHAAVGTKVRASAAGKVIFTGYKSGYGNTVIINHGYGLQTYYAHNSKIKVKTGQTVKKGQLICYSGNTGTTTGPHLHFEVRVHGKPVNPLTFLNK